MKRLAPLFFSTIFILFWFLVIWIQLHDFSRFKNEMNNQIFSAPIANVLVYILPSIELLICLLLTLETSRRLGHLLSAALLLGYTIYVGLALLNVYSRMPCNCAGLLGENSSWTANFIFNLSITAVAVAGFIFNFRDEERRKQGMDTVVSHAPSPR